MAAHECASPVGGLRHDVSLGDNFLVVLLYLSIGLWMICGRYEMFDP